MSITSSEKMTTQWLQKRYPDVYQKFFMKHHIVYSLPQVINRGYSPRRRIWANVHMKQKLPTKLYIGISITSSSKVCCWPTTYYTIERQWFEESSLDFLYKRKIEKEICEYMSSQLPKDWTKTWYEISFLIESSRWFWYDVTRWICMWMSLAQWLATWKSYFDDRGEIDKESYTMLEKQALIYDARFFNPWIDQSMSWFMTYMMNCKDSFPLIQVWSRVSGAEGGMWDWELVKKRIVSSEWDTWWSFWSHVDSYKIIHSRDIWWWSWGGDIDWLSFEYVLFTLWTPYYSPQIKSMYMNEDHPKESSSVTNLCKDRDVSLTPWAFSQLCEPIYQHMANGMIRYLQKPSQENLQKLFTSLTNCWWFHAMVEGEKQCLIDLYHHFSLFKQSQDEKVAFVPVSWSLSWGTFLAVIKRSSRRSFEQFMESFTQKVNDCANVLYVSWRDWPCSDWIILHQHIPQQIFSSHISDSTVEYVSPAWAKRFWDYLELLEEKHEWILVDTIWKKLYMWGRKLTSKEVSSQSMTVELIMYLSEKNGYIHNSKLPLSSYSSNKNDMVWKILLPLKKLVKKHFNAPLDISCTWSLYDFHVKMSLPHNLFHLVNKIPAMR